ncbi:MAG: hypothetical protein GY696_20865, partial [Gammaproteobacteria bacterium]|nr:hypothetical protein [Gammaproteobacteria bacterium]
MGKPGKDWNRPVKIELRSSWEQRAVLTGYVQARKDGSWTLGETSVRESLPLAERQLLSRLSSENAEKDSISYTIRDGKIAKFISKMVDTGDGQKKKWIRDNSWKVPAEGQE